MTKSITQDALNIRKLVREAEALSDELLLACARLKQAMVVARQNPEVKVATGQAALLRLAEAESQALSTSSNLFRLHEEMNKVARVQAGFDHGMETETAQDAKPVIAMQDA